MARTSGCLGVGAGGVMADETIDIFLCAKVETFIFPSVTDMATGAIWIVGLWGNAEIIQHIALAEALSAVRIEKLPGPMFGLVDLSCRLGMTSQAGPGDRRARREFSLEFLETAVVRSGIGNYESGVNTGGQHDHLRDNQQSPMPVIPTHSRLPIILTRLTRQHRKAVQAICVETSPACAYQNWRFKTPFFSRSSAQAQLL